MLIPVGLPVWLWMERLIGWRRDDRTPRWREIAFVLVTWTVAAELIAPRLFTHATGDGWDVVACRRSAGGEPVVAISGLMNFDCLAPHYDWMEAVMAGGLLQRARMNWLESLVDCRRILSVGEGHGKFAAAFGRRFPEAELTCVEASQRMLERGRRRTDRSGVSAQWMQAAVPTWSPPVRRFDAIVTCFFLDCFPPAQLRTVVAALAAGATDRAAWLLVDFAIPDRGVARWGAQAIHAAMYGFFRAATRLQASRLSPPDELLRAHGFRLAAHREFSYGLLRADLWRR